MGGGVKEPLILADVICEQPLIYGDMSEECPNHHTANQFIRRSMADNNKLKAPTVVWREDMQSWDRKHVRTNLTQYFQVKQLVFVFVYLYLCKGQLIV